MSPKLMIVGRYTVLVLRYKRPAAREWKVPPNFRIGKTEIPMGLFTITLFALAVINVLTKKTATIAGSIFTGVFFVAFFLSERHNKEKQPQSAKEQEEFRLDEQSDLSIEVVLVRPGNVLVEVSRPDHMEHLSRVLAGTNPDKQDVVAVAVHRLAPLASSEYEGMGGIERPRPGCSHGGCETFSR